MKKLTSILTLAIALSGASAFGHGEDMKGPNGGYIKMPGAFHTEAIVLEKNKLKVYLLDMNFKNPTVQDSSIEVTFKGHHTEKGDCKVEANFFVCSFSKDVDLKSKATLEVKAVYQKQKGNAAVYSTPLKIH